MLGEPHLDGDVDEFDSTRLLAQVFEQQGSTKGDGDKEVVVAIAVDVDEGATGGDAAIFEAVGELA